MSYRLKPNDSEKTLRDADDDEYDGLFGDFLPYLDSQSGQKDKKRKLSDIAICKCKNSQCLKLYCECFAQSVTCAEACKCQNCKNTTEEHVLIQRARSSIERRNPKAFEKKIIHGNRHASGCKCRNSKCQKNYCECFRAGVDCTNYCECSDCNNGGKEVFHTAIQSDDNIFRHLLES
jgi:hypothetical protein